MAVTKMTDWNWRRFLAVFIATYFFALFFAFIINEMGRAAAGIIAVSFNELIYKAFDYILLPTLVLALVIYFISVVILNKGKLKDMFIEGLRNNWGWFLLLWMSFAIVRMLILIIKSDWGLHMNYLLLGIGTFCLSLFLNMMLWFTNRRRNIEV
jgi:hypothetical protein